MRATWLSESELRDEERSAETSRFDTRQFCVWCVGHGCVDCFYTGLPERWFEKWHRQMRGVSRRQMARAAMAFHAWACGDGGDQQQMSIGYGVPLHMISQDNPYNLLEDWIFAFHDLGTAVDEVGAEQGCHVLASIYMSEANR